MHIKETKGNCEIYKDASDDDRIARLKPKGFWIDTITVSQFKSACWPDDARKWGTPEIRWSSGGRDGTLSDIEETKNFIEALGYAIEIYTEWVKED